jgi:cytochrome b
MNKQVYVWDKFVRLFHWTLLLLFIGSYVTGEEEHWLHSYSGYAIFILVSLRIVWGFVGTHYARFSDFVYSPATVSAYLKSMVNRSPKHYLGHNPAGGMMVIALLAALLMTTLSGMKLYAIEEGKGPFAQSYSTALITAAYADSDKAKRRTKDEHEDAEEFWEEIHEASINFMWLLIVLHVAGVTISSIQHKEWLPKAMITGYKTDK